MGRGIKVRGNATWDRDATISVLDTRKRRFYESSGCSFIDIRDVGVTCQPL